MQFKSFMEALKGKQHKIDKNKNGQIDAQDFKLLRKEESEETTETIEESEERMARADYKVGVSGRKSHKEIVFDDAESKDDEEDKKDMKEAKMSDADMAERERIVKGMKKNLAGFKARYGERAKEVMYATATKQAMKEETVEEAFEFELTEGSYADLHKKWGDTHKIEYHSHTLYPKHTVTKFDNEKDAESHAKKTGGTVRMSVSPKMSNEAVQKADIPAYLRKQQGQTPLKLSDLKRKDTLSDKENLAKARNEEVEEIDEKSDQAKQNKTMKNMMDASRGARYKLNNPVPAAEPEHKTARAQNVAIGRALRSEERKDDVPFEGPYTKVKANVKDKSGAVHTPMSRAKDLARAAMKKQMKEDIDRLFEAKDEQEYGYEGDMAMNQLATLTRCAEMIKDTLKPDTDLPEWVQSKITLATDYIVTAADYLHSELEEQAPVAPVPDKKYIKGTPENKAYMATKKSRVGHPTSTASTHELSSDELGIKKEIAADRLEKKAMKMYKEESELDEVEHKTLSYTDFVATLLEYETKGGRYVHKGTYGGSYSDPEGADDADDKKPKQKSAEKRGRGRPAGAKSGAGKITGTSKLYK